MHDRDRQRRRPARRGRHDVSVSATGVRAGIAHAELADVATHVLRAHRVPTALLSIALLDARAMARLNREFTGHRGATDVLAFGLGGSGPVAVVGDIYICPAVARAHAGVFGASIREELRRLVVHGTLHVLGWDHPHGAARVESPMWRRQEELLARWRRTR